MHMGIKPPRQAHFRVEFLPAVAGVPRFSELQSSINKLDVGTLAQCVVDNSFVFINCDRTGRVNEIPAGFGVGGYTVDCAEDELFLEVRQKRKVAVRL